MAGQQPGSSELSEKIPKAFDGKLLDELKSQVASLDQELEEAEDKYLQLVRKEDVSKKQQVFLKNKAADLIEKINNLEKVVSSMRTEATAEADKFINTINQALVKNEEVAKEAKIRSETMHKEKRVFDENRKKYFKLKGEIEALSLFKDYQEIVVSELENLHSHVQTTQEVENLSLSYFSS